MSVTLRDGCIHLTGACLVEDAEHLLVLVQANPEYPVDVGQLTQLHAAVLQVLLAFRPAVIGSPQEAFIVHWLMPLLDGSAVK